MAKTLKKKLKIVVIVGPTASGKSELAIRLAKQFNGEIVSADSRQVYRGLDIGTGKIPGKWQQNPTSRLVRQNSKIFVYKTIPHYCIDFVSPKRVFTAADFKKCAESAIRNINHRGKIPIMAGGTGFYIDAVLYENLLPNVPSDKTLRRALSRKTTPKLFALLKALDPKRAKDIDWKNPRRLVRAIEIARTLGRVPKLKKKSNYEMLWIGVSRPDPELNQRIHKRLIARLREGMVQEAQTLHKRGLAWKRFYELGLEYRFLAEYLRKKMSREEMILQLERAIKNYARRQRTWFRKNTKINWVSNQDKAEKLINRFIKNNAPIREKTDE